MVLMAFQIIAIDYELIACRYNGASFAF